MNTPNNWQHKSGYHLNADGKAIKYEHTERAFVAIVEGIHNDHDHSLDYYTVIFDESVTPMEVVEGHEVWADKETAKNRLEELMKEYN